MICIARTPRSIFCVCAYFVAHSLLVIEFNFTVLNYHQNICLLGFYHFRVIMYISFSCFSSNLI